jgi:aryl-alcohol dehydrogenase-like predicted oxidoreductase
VQATYNLLERTAAPALERAHDAGLGIIVKEALANGRLTARGGLAPLQRTAEGHGATPDALAIAAVLAKPWVDVVLSGAATVDQLQSNLAAARLDWTVVLEEELAELAEPSDRYWSARSSLSWA